MSLKYSLRIFAVEFGLLIENSRMDESILINRTVIPTDWESDVSTKEVKNEIEVSVSAFSSITSRISALLRYSGLTTQSGCNLPSKLIHIISQSSPWQISLSPCGQYLAILRRNHLELRIVRTTCHHKKSCENSREKLFIPLKICCG